MADQLRGKGSRRPRRWLRRLGFAAVALGCAVGLSSCTRSFFRKCADKEVDAVLAQKDKYPAWHIEQYHVYPDPRARFADPTNPDRPPMPPDDPAAHDLSPNPQRPGPSGVARIEGTGYLALLNEWDRQNRAEAAAAKARQAEGEKQSTDQAPEPRPAGPGGKPAAPPPDTPVKPARLTLDTGDGDPPAAGAAAKPADQTAKPAAEAPSTTTSLAHKAKPDERSPYLLKLEQTVELGLINSREYQDAREDLFLTALPVTLERFAFAPQFFALGQAIRQWAGGRAPGGKQNNWTLNSNAGLTQLFSTGALLLVNFANQTVFNLGGVAGRPLTSVSTINLDLVQPLLRGGGRAVTLEPLTQAERNLLYEIRNFARFREEFYVSIAGGGGGSITGATFQPTGVIAPTGFAPGAGVGSSGLVPGVVPAVNVTGNPGLQVGPGPSGRIPLTTAFAAPVSGYLTTLLRAAELRVDEYNIQKLQGYLELAKAIQEGGDISQLQVDQFEQQVLFRRSTLLTDQQAYLASLDQFKLQLGLPTDLRIELDDTPFRPLNQQFQRYEDLFNEYMAAGNEPLRFGGLDQVAAVRGELRRIFTTSALVKGTRFRTTIAADWHAWETLSDDALRQRLADYREEVRRLLGQKTDLETSGRALAAADQERLETAQFEIDLGTFEEQLRSYESRPWKALATPALQRRRQQAEFRYLVNAFVNVLTQARNERLVQLRRTWPDLARLCVNGVDLLKGDLGDAEAAAVQTALIRRLDLMNVRAQVVDAWRQVAVFANALLGTFNIEYHLTSTTPPELAEPLAFAGSRTRHQLFLDGELPLVRKAERNNYRAALINFQRARRILQRAEDQVMFDTRDEVRLLRQQEEQYRIQQRQVELGYLTVENSLDVFQQPPAPMPAGQALPDTTTRAAALTSQLLMAQQNLITAQTQMNTIWITYLNTRLQLYRDMELMPLDFRGVWIDDVATCECPDARDRQPGTGPAQPAGQRGGPDGGARPERLPEPRPVSAVQGPWLDDAN